MTAMGAFRPKRCSAANLHWHQQRRPSDLSIAISGCRTVIGLLLLAASGVYMLKFLPDKVETDERLNQSIQASVLVDGVGHVINLDAGDALRRNVSTDRNVHLAAVIFNRVFEQDLFNITAYECRQWIEYMLFSGVDHVFWYDTAHGEEESQEVYLKEYVKKGLLTYHRFHHLFPGNVDAGYHFEQDHSYEHFLKSYSSGIRWVVEMDVDEYPLMASDLKRSFLRRYVQHLEKSRPDVTQILLPCMIFGGNPEGDEKDGWVIERYQRRKRAPEGARPGFSSRTKPIFQPEYASGVSFFDPHQFPMRSGNTMVTFPEVLRMNHYWGPRLSDFKPDTAAVKALLVPDTSAQVIATELKAITGLTNKAAALRQVPQ